MDIDNRPKIHNEDGSFSTLSTATREWGGKAINFPTIINGKRVGEEEAFVHAIKNNQHLGMFDNIDEAVENAKGLSKRQGSHYIK